MTGRWRKHLTFAIVFAMLVLCALVAMALELRLTLLFIPRNSFPSEKLNILNESEPSKFSSQIAGLYCTKYGGPSNEVAAEMVYWSDIPSDAKHVSPFKNYGPEHKFLTFEADVGGWNNVRMSMETAVALAFAMGRTLVLPPEQGINLLRNGNNGQKTKFGFKDFFPIDFIGKEHPEFQIISTQHFLEDYVLAGKVRDKSGRQSWPPKNRTNWDSAEKMTYTRTIELWLRDFSRTVNWNGNECVSVFPDKPGNVSYHHLFEMLGQIKNETTNVMKRISSFHNNPTPVDAVTKERLREHLSMRSDLCIYDQEMQQEQVLHFTSDHRTGYRLLVHFYVYLFFEEWKQDVWTKRFVRDHLRYGDEIQCAAARVVDRIRTIAKENGDMNGSFDTAHIRRGDFQLAFKDSVMSAANIYERVHDILHENATLYVATDERNKTFFDPLREHYKLYFLDDFGEEIRGINSNYFGMIEQLVAARGRTFVGTGHSTFSGYINRLRGYYSQKEKLDGHSNGTLNSYYFAPALLKSSMSNYDAFKQPFWAREWPVGWRDIDRGTGGEES